MVKKMDQMIAKQHDDIADVDENPQESKDVEDFQVWLLSSCWSRRNHLMKKHRNT